MDRQRVSSALQGLTVARARQSSSLTLLKHLGHCRFSPNKLKNETEACKFGLTIRKELPDHRQLVWWDKVCQSIEREITLSTLDQDQHQCLNRKRVGGGGGGGGWRERE